MQQQMMYLLIILSIDGLKVAHTDLFVIGTEDEPLSDVDPLENLLIEHPSMSVYQMRSRVGGEEEEELVSEDGDTSRLLSVHTFHHELSLA